MLATRHYAAAIPNDMAELIDDVIANSPLIENRSAFLRHGLRLALAEAVRHQMIRDPQLEQRVTHHLDEYKIAIGEPLGRN